MRCISGSEKIEDCDNHDQTVLHKEQSDLGFVFRFNKYATLKLNISLLAATFAVS